MSADATALRPLTPPTYGVGLLDGLDAGLLERPIVLTQPEPWALVRAHFPDGATQVVLVEDMEHDRVRARSEAFAPGSAVFGIGGGSAVDHAKYTAWARDLPLVTIPTILSVDAPYTRAVGVREGSRVRYVGDAVPTELLVDFELLRRAPPLLNRAGVGDVLSIFTALWDWAAAHRAHGEAFDARIAEASEALLDRLFAGATAIRDCTDEGLHLLSELYVGEVALCEQHGNARPEEGSEHYIAYALEARTRGRYIHGQLIGMCVLLAGAYQGQDVGPAMRFLRDVGLDPGFEAVGTTRAEMREVLLGMGDYVRDETHLLPGVFHLRGAPSKAEVEPLLDLVEEASR